MIIKPKTRKAPAKRTALAQAIARHKTAQAAYNARTDGHEDVTDPLWTAEGNAFEVLAETPCANDAEFIGKLRYMLAHDIRIWGDPDHRDEFGSILVAVDRHFNRAVAPAPRLRYLTLKLRALCWVLRRLRAGRLSWPEG